jgi:hypothetical protein
MQLRCRRCTREVPRALRRPVALDLPAGAADVERAVEAVRRGDVAETV